MDKQKGSNLLILVISLCLCLIGLCGLYIFPPPKSIPTFRPTIYNGERDLLRKEYRQRIKTFKKNCPKLRSHMTEYSPGQSCLFYTLPQILITGTTLMAEQLMVVLNGSNHESHNPHINILKSFPLPKKDFSQLKQVFSMIFVRHPFVRFTSAFRMLQKKHVKDLMMNNGISFNGKFPTMAEFLPLFLQYPRFNNHFFPFWYHCKPCDMHLNFIGKMETFLRDHKFIDKKMGFNMSKRAELRQANSTKYCCETKLYAMEAFRTLTKKQVLQLYNVYKPDFLLFGYDIEPFYSLAMEDA